MRRAVLIVLLLAACGCSHAEDQLVLPWCKYRTVKTPGGSGIWGGSSHNEVLVRRWWGWIRVFDENAAPGQPIVLTPTAVFVPMAGVARILRESDSAAPFACGDEKAAPTVPPAGGFVDCADHLAGPAPAIATSLRVRRVDPLRQLISQQEFSAGDPGRVFLIPAVSFYDDAGTPYLVTFYDPWAEETPDGSRRTGQATPEQLAKITCELIAVGQNPTQALPAPPGHKIADCSSGEMWRRVLGRPLRDPWKRSG